MKFDYMVFSNLNMTEILNIVSVRSIIFFSNYLVNYDPNYISGCQNLLTILNNLLLL